MRRQIGAGPAAAALGALLLLVSLFVDWYEPGVSAFTVFEVLDLVLAALALAALAAAAERLTAGGGAGDTSTTFGPALLPLLGGIALLIVVSQVVNHPPAAVGRDPEAGQWLGLAGAALIAAGGVLGVTRISLAVNVDRRAAGADEGAGSPVAAADKPSPPAEARAAEPEVQDELYPEPERSGPIGADDPETGAPVTSDETRTPPGDPGSGELSERPAGRGEAPG